MGTTPQSGRPDQQSVAGSRGHSLNATPAIEISNSFAKLFGKPGCASADAAQIGAPQCSDNECASSVTATR